MGPGGYRFRDYFRAGLPLVLLLFALLVGLLPLVWPLTPR
jgi:solute carrier family 13 (sodium-dependent dicarboxylate transporter), member 2/3/5